MIDLTKKKILVTGGSGFLGSHIVGGLVRRGVPQENIFAPRREELDLRERESCEKAVRGRNIVIHSAAFTGNVELFQKHPAEIFYDNLMMGVELMNAASRAGIEKFVTIGSATEYPDNAPPPFKEEDLWVGPIEEIHAPYTVAKKALLIEAQAYRKQYGFNAIHLLLASMYGPGEHADGGPIPAFICRIGEAKKKNVKFIEAWGTGKPTRDFLYIEDAAEGVLLAVEKYDKPKPMNLASGFGVSIKELVKLIARLMDFHGEIHWDTSKPDGQMRRLLDTTRAKRELGFIARTDFESGLRQTIKYHGY